MHRVIPGTTLYYKNYKACTKQVPVLLCTTHKIFPCTTLYYKACTKHFPVLLCTTKLAQSTSQYYFVLQSLQRYSSTALYCKACTSTRKYYFVLQSLHNTLPSSTWYYKACTKHFTVPLCTTKLAPVQLCTTQLSQNTSLCTTKLAQGTMYYFVLQSLHKARPSNTWYYKACTKNFPALLCTTKLAHNTSQNTSSFDTQQAFPHSKLLHTASIYYTKNELTHSKLLCRKAFTPRKLYTQKAFTHRKLYAQQAFAQRRFNIEKLWKLSGS